jgi:hypothetical protein
MYIFYDQNLLYNNKYIENLLSVSINIYCISNLNIFGNQNSICYDNY